MNIQIKAKQVQVKNFNDKILEDHPIYINDKSVKFERLKLMLVNNYHKLYNKFINYLLKNKG